MKYMITAALALCLIGGAAAAQDHDHGRGGEGGRGGGQEHRGGGPQGGGRGGPQGGFRGGPQGAPAQVAPPPQSFQGRPGGGGGGERRDFRGRDEFRGGGFAPQAPQQGERRFEGRPGQGGGERRDFRGPGREEFRGGGVPAPGPGFRGERRGPEPGYRPGYYARDHGWRGGRAFRAAPYRYPVGWGYSRWAYGAFLPFVFLAPDYTLYDYWVYGLPAPPPGYHWIRVGPDALLVRYGDGYVLDAIYGIFY